MTDWKSNFTFKQNLKLFFSIMKSLLSFIFVALVISNVHGQGEFTLYNLNRSVPQAHQLNPAFRPDAKVVIGLPVISSSHVSVDMDQLSFNNIFTKSAEQSLSLNAENLSSVLRENNNFSIKSDLQLFFLGLNLGNNFISLSFNDRVSSLMVYTKDIADLVLFGNGDERTFGKNLSLDKMMLRQNLYHEVALGYSRNFGGKLSIGARFKILSGVVNSQTDQINGYFRTDADSIHITNSNLTFRNSGYDYFTGELDVLSMYRNTLPFVGGNSGFGLDLGADFQATDRINISASVTDLGYIDWKENTKSYQIDNVTYSFKGFDVVDLINSGGNNNDFFQNELDSLESLYTHNEQENIAYRSSLVSNFYTGFDYKISKNHHVGAQVYGKMAEGNITPEFGAYYNLRLGKVVNAVVNASFRNGKIHAAGAGVSVDMGPIQIYGTTESVTSLINPQAANLLDARVGLNLKFGRKKMLEQQKLVEEEDNIDELLLASEATVDEPEEIELDEATNTVSEQAIQPEIAAVIPVAISNEPAPPIETSEELIASNDFNESPILIDEPDVIEVKHGEHKDELKIGHYVVVGAFLGKANALEYSLKLKRRGYNNEFGFLTEKDFYYVTVYKSIGDLESARKVRDQFRQKNEFLFPDSWLLTVVE